MRSQSKLYSRYFTYIKTFTKLPIVKTYGSTIFTLVMMTIFIIFAIKPTVETILVLQKKLTDSNKILEQLTKKATDLNKTKENYAALEKNNYISKISAAIPDKPDLKSITQTLENITKKYEASISAFQVEPQVLESKKEDTNSLGVLSQVVFTLNVTGQYKNLMSLLDDINRNTRLISIDKLTLSQLSEDFGLSMSMTAKAYYLK